MDKYLLNRHTSIPEKIKFVCHSSNSIHTTFNQAYYKMLRTFMKLMIVLKISEVMTFETECDKNHAINISNGAFDDVTKTIKHEDVVYPPDKYFTHVDHGDELFGCVCDLKVCVAKCCTDATPRNSSCESGYSPDVQINTHNDDFTLAEQNAKHLSVEWKECMYLVLEPDDIYYILEDGRLYFPLMEMYFELNEYCVVQFRNETHNNIEVRLCFHEEDFEEDGISLNTYGMLISVPFLLATLIIYFILPDKKIQIKCMMAYVTCLMLSYIVLIYLQFNADLPSPHCQIMASLGLYFFMATFCWMNVTCIDMYWTFSGKRGPVQGNSSKWKRFLLYCAFANGAPLILLAIVFGVNSLKTFHGHPEFGHGQCWLAHGLSQFLYFYLPMAILVSINFVLFIITAHTIRTTIRDNQKMLRSKESQRHSESNKQDYVLYVKLFGAMGINWTMEFISFTVDWCLGHDKVTWIWYPTDFCNAIYGIFIFVLFVCKKAVWIKLKQRYYVCMGKPNMARALSTHTSGNHTSVTERTNVEDSTVSHNYSMKLNPM